MEQEKEIVHRSIAFGRAFTSQEWSDFCRNERSSHEVTVTDNVSAFEWNVCDVCRNPNVIKSSGKASGLPEFEIETASFRGKWYYGYSYSHTNGGGCSGVNLRREGYETKQAAIEAAAERLLKYRQQFELSDKAISELKALCRPVPVQLSLF